MMESLGVLWGAGVRAEHDGEGGVSLSLFVPPPNSRLHLLC